MGTLIANGETVSSLFWLAAIESLEREQDLSYLAPKASFIGIARFRSVANKLAKRYFYLKSMFFLAFLALLN